MPEPSAHRFFGSRAALLVALLVSVLLHAGLGLYLHQAFTMPALDIEFQLPLDVEFGMTEGVALAPEMPDAPVEPPADGASKPDEAVVDAPLDEPKPKDKPRPERKPKTADAGTDEAPEKTPDKAKNSGLLPAGAQITLRVDMLRIRNSPIAEDVRGLLAAIPDWKALLDGSDIDPVSQLDRLMIATPNLQRSNIIVAGRYQGSEEVVHEAVARLAAARGVEAEWRARGGVRVAPWANLDTTPRVIALIGPAHFSISREEDLERVFAVAVARARKSRNPRASAAQDASTPEEHPADALLSMGPDEGISVEVEGVSHFVRRKVRGVPEKLRLSAIERPGPMVELQGELDFADAAAAEDGAQFWRDKRDAYARNALVALLGLSQPLREGSIEATDNRVILRILLGVEQTRLILGYLREMFRPPPSRQDVQPSP